MLATYKDRDPGVSPASPRASADGQVSGAAQPRFAQEDVRMHLHSGLHQCCACVIAQAVYIMSMEMDGAGACSGLLFPDDRILEVDGEPAVSLQQVCIEMRTRSLLDSESTAPIANHLKLPRGS